MNPKYLARCKFYACSVGFFSLSFSYRFVPGNKDKCQGETSIQSSSFRRPSYCFKNITVVELFGFSKALFISQDLVSHRQQRLISLS